MKNGEEMEQDGNASNEVKEGERGHHIACLFTKHGLLPGHLSSGYYPREDQGSSQRFRPADKRVEEEKGGGGRDSWGVTINSEFLTFRGKKRCSYWRKRGWR